jgi:Fe-S cluster biogenesis protein NfuA
MGYVIAMTDAEIFTRIQEILHEVQPLIIGHGGRIELQSYKDGIVEVQLQGACISCPMSMITLKLGLEERLREAFPMIKSVVAHQ